MNCQGAYRKWAENNNFVSKLPKDVQRMKAALAAEKDKQKQQHVDEAIKKMPKKERVIQYSHALFRKAAIEWLVSTDQVRPDI